MSMPIFQFPRKIYFQRDILAEISPLLQREGIGRILIVTDKIIRRIVEDRISNMRDFQVDIFDEVLPEPEVGYIESVSLSMRGKQYDAIMAIGGGSVIDFSKSLLVKKEYPDKDLRDVNPFEPLNFKTKLIAVPTTSGTGSDASFGVVLTDGDRKLALANYDLIPEIIILDSSLAPKNERIIVSTGIDALVHSFEALVANTSSDLTDALAERAIITIFDNLEGSVRGEEEAKEKMHLAATMAGIAFSNSGTAIAHALGHSLGATFHVTHGTCVGLFLPHAIRFNSIDGGSRVKYERIAKMLGLKNVGDLIAFIETFYKRIGQPVRVRDTGVNEKEYGEKVGLMASKAMMDSELAFNPVMAGEDELKSIFLSAY